MNGILAICSPFGSPEVSVIQAHSHTPTLPHTYTPTRTHTHTHTHHTHHTHLTHISHTSHTHLTHISHTTHTRHTPHITTNTQQHTTTHNNTQQHTTTQHINTHNTHTHTTHTTHTILSHFTKTDKRQSEQDPLRRLSQARSWRWFRYTVDGHGGNLVSPFMRVASWVTKQLAPIRESKSFLPFTTVCSNCITLRSGHRAWCALYSVRCGVCGVVRYCAVLCRGFRF